MSESVKKVTKAAGLMMAAILLSRVLGLVRDMVIAHQFGGGGEVSAYNMAFTLPDTLYFMLSSGALSSAFIPVFTEYITKGREEDAWKIFSTVGTFIFIVISGIIILCEVFANQIMPVVAMGFMKEHPDLMPLTIYLTRIILPSQMFFFMGGLIIATLYARQHFLAPAAGPVIYNIFIILGGLLLASVAGIAGLTWGVLVGAFIGNFLLQLLVARRIGIKFRPSLNLRHPGVVQVGKLALPVILGLSLAYFDVNINKWFAAFLHNESAVAALSYANRLMQVPLGVFGQAAAVAIFPMMAAQAARKEIGNLKASVNFGVRGILLLTLPASALLIVLASPIVTALFQRGEFTPQNGIDVSAALICYAVGIGAWSAQSIITRGFYALQDTVVPIVTGSITTIIFIPLNWFLMWTPLGHAGLALATSIAATINLIALFEIFRRRMGGINGWLIAISLVKVAISSVACGLIAWLVYRYMTHMVDVTHPKGALIGLLAASVPAVLAYAGMVYVLKVEEAHDVWNMFLSRLRKKPA